MHIAAKLLRGLGLVLGVLALSFVVVLAVLQTQLGKAWLAREIGQTLGDPDFTIAMDGPKGFVPIAAAAECVIQLTYVKWWRRNRITLYRVGLQLLVDANGTRRARRYRDDVEGGQSAAQAYGDGVADL